MTERNATEGVGGRGGISRCRTARGFTLIEVLVALAMFVAVAMALDSALSANVRGMMHYEAKTLGTWVAANKLVELQVWQQWPEKGRQDDESEFAGQRWFVRTEVSDGPFSGTRKVVISSGPQPEQILAEKEPVATITALLAEPPVEVAPAPGGDGGGADGGATGDGGSDGESDGSGDQ